MRRQRVPMRGFAIAAVLALAALLTTGVDAGSPSGDWNLVHDSPSPNFRGIDFVDESEGWLLAGGGLLHTTDGGATWTEAAQLTGIDVDFADAEHGWLVGYSGSIYRTSDGATWEPQASGSQVHLSDVFAVSAQQAWAVGSGEGFSDIVVHPTPAAFLHTTDGGTTWEQVAIPPDIWFNEITFVGQNGWALGVQSCPGDPPPASPPSPICSFGTITGALLRTTDGGQTWSLEDAPAVSYSMVFVSQTHGWMIGCGGAVCQSTIHNTTDGGLTWNEQVHPNAGSFLALTFRDELHGWALAEDCGTPVCDYALYTTIDGGATWSVQPIDVQARHLYPAVMSSSNGAVYLVGDGPALRSLDDGATWERMQHPALGMTEVDFVDPNVGFALSSGDILRTDDAGRTWEVAGPAPNAAREVAFLDGRRGVAVAVGCCPERVLISRTTDGGRSWSVAHDEATGDDCCMIQRLQFVDDSHGWVAMQKSVLLTNDGGARWERVPFSGPSAHIPSADLVTASDAWAIGDGAVFGATKLHLLHSNDGGRTWEVVPGRSDEELREVDFVDPQHGWYTSCCPPHRLFATEDGGASWRDVTSVQGHFSDLVFADALNAWRTTADELLYSADGGRTWESQLSVGFSEASLEFVDAQNGWLLLPAGRGTGFGGGVPQRVELYHMGAGPLPATPQLPQTGAPDDSGSSWAVWAAVAAATVAGLALVAGALMRRKRVWHWLD